MLRTPVVISPFVVKILNHKQYEKTMKTKIKETILGHIKAIEKQLDELDEVESSDTASPLSPADLRARALAGKTMYYDIPSGGSGNTSAGLVFDISSELTCFQLFDYRAVFIDGDKAYRENTPSPLQLRVGGRYLSRGGREVMIIEESEYPIDYPFVGDNEELYTSCGNFYRSGVENEYDLIKEI